MTGGEMREILEALLPAEEIERLCRELGVVQRERKLDVTMFARMMVLAAGTPSGARQADVLRAYFESGATPVARSAGYRWFDAELEALLQRLSERALTYARSVELDLPGVLGGVSDWIIVDSTTVRVCDDLIDEYPGAGNDAALKVHKLLSVGSGVPIEYHFSPAREHDSRHLAIDETWRGRGLLADLGYASIERLRACVRHGVTFIIRLKENWKPRVQQIHRGDVQKTFFAGADFDVACAAGGQAQCSGWRAGLEAGGVRVDLAPGRHANGQFTPDRLLARKGGHSEWRSDVRLLTRGGVVASLVLGLMLAVPVVAMGQGGGHPDVVETIDGERVRGTILEVRRDGSVVLQDYRGELREFEASEVRHAGPIEATGREEQAPAEVTPPDVSGPPKAVSEDPVRVPETVRLQINSDWEHLRTYRRTVLMSVQARSAYGAGTGVSVGRQYGLCEGSCTVEVPPGELLIAADGRRGWPRMVVRGG